MTTEYREWLLSLVIEYGVGNLMPFDVRSDLTKGFYWVRNEFEKAIEMNHIISVDNDEFQLIGFILTPNATKYLERYSG
jgi:hypothetical protein